MSELTEFRRAKDQFFARDSQSPFLPEQRRDFPHLEYFPEDPSYRFVLELVEFPPEEQEVIEMATSTGDARPSLRWGRLEFSVGGQTATLTVYKSDGNEEFFLPFGDATNGADSYGAGRYLDLVPMEDGQLLVDFNYAYNPYCAYNPRWSCPIPPAENRLKIPISAGEKKYPGASED